MPKGSKATEYKHLWKPGQSGNPSGRPKGSKNAFGEQFWKDLAAEWANRGPKALQALDDLEFAKLAAGKAPTLIEADIDIRVNAWLDVMRRAGDEGPS